ncbi:MAG TPA: hypothetical protein PKD64_13760 [Pirellulaceae bacterium]|nr:hypothetical protein [Pirellulaceae bacterium]HMO93252.1 hypothetical protein [Pirellulaceae bacterium]HMP69117.1 hypothetical protein [Pirellulaceae bacterium]
MAGQHSRFGLILLAIVATVCGCRVPQNERYERAIALLRAEKIDLEDRYFELEAKYKELSGEGFYSSGGKNRNLNESRSTPILGAPKYDEIEHDWSPDSSQEIENLPRPVLRPDRESRRGRNSRNADIEIPDIIIEGGDFSVQDHSGIQRTTLNSDQPTLFFPSPNETHNQDSQVDTDAKAYKQSVDSRSHDLTRDIVDVVVDYDGQQRRANSSWLIVQPRDGDGNSIPLPGDIILSIIDTTATGEEQRVGLWSFDRAKVASWIQNQPSSKQGLNIPKPSVIESRDLDGLVAFVRYTTPDLQVFEISFPLDSTSAQGDSTGTSTKRRETPVRRDANTTRSGSDKSGSIDWSPSR